MFLQEKIRQAADIIKHSDALLITAGAGMGVDSGLPDFRGKEGFWKAYPKAKELDVSFAELANPKWFKTNPQLAWAFYGHRLNLYRKTTPHKGFEILQKWVKSKRENYFVVTSNVDGQFQKAGFSTDKILEIHGSIHYFQCSIPCTDDIWPAAENEVEVDQNTFTALEPLPRCPYCGAVARPNILMFSDFHWISHRSAEQETRYLAWLERQKKNKNKITVVEIGAGTAVPSIRYLSESFAAGNNAALIRINPRESQIQDKSLHAVELPATALDALLKIDQLL